MCRVFLYFFSCPQLFIVISYLHYYTDERFSLGKQYSYNGYKCAGNTEPASDPPIFTPPENRVLIILIIPYSIYCFLLFSLYKNQV